MRSVGENVKYNVSIGNLMRNVKSICEWERLSGSEDELKAFRYIENEMKKNGLKTDLVFHDAYISLPVSGKLVVDGTEFSCHTASMAKSTPPDGVKGRLVYHEDIDLMTEENCRGNIVAIGGSSTFEKTIKAWELGARGVIGSSGERFHEKIISNAWGSPSIRTKGLIPDVPYVYVVDKDAESIKKAAVSRMAIAHMITVVDTGWRKIPQLTAEVRAPRKTDKYVMFSGHVDSWFYGATDNGTANAVQLEVARIAMENRSSLKRNVKFIFYSGHSHGRYAGSAWHADHNWQDLYDNCVINVNADIIGGKGATDLTRSIIMPEARAIAADIIKAQTGVDFKGGRCGRNGDQSYFAIGVTSAFASFSKQPRPDDPEDKLAQTRSGAYDFGWWWHTADDLPDKIDPEFFRRDADIYASFVMRFAISDVVPLDFHEAALEIEDLVEYWIEKAKGRFDLSVARAKAKDLLSYCEKLYAGEPKDADAFNALLMRLERELVPLNYTTGNIYENDSGVPLPPMPSLKLIETLVKAPVGSDEENEILVELVHKLNFVLHGLSTAIELIRGYLGENNVL